MEQLDMKRFVILSLNHTMASLSSIFLLFLPVAMLPTL